MYVVFQISKIKSCIADSRLLAICLAYLTYKIYVYCIYVCTYTLQIHYILCMYNIWLNEGLGSDLTPPLSECVVGISARDWWNYPLNGSPVRGRIRAWKREAGKKKRDLENGNEIYILKSYFQLLNSLFRPQYPNEALKIEILN